MTYRVWPLSPEHQDDPRFDDPRNWLPSEEQVTLSVISVYEEPSHPKQALRVILKDHDGAKWVVEPEYTSVNDVINALRRHNLAMTEGFRLKVTLRRSRLGLAVWTWTLR